MPPASPPFGTQGGTPLGNPFNRAPAIEPDGPVCYTAPMEITVPIDTKTPPETDFDLTSPAEDVAALVNLLHQVLDGASADDAAVYLHKFTGERRGTDYGIDEAIGLLARKYGLDRNPEPLETF